MTRIPGSDATQVATPVAQPEQCEVPSSAAQSPVDVSTPPPAIAQAGTTDTDAFTLDMPRGMSSCGDGGRTRRQTDPVEGSRGSGRPQGPRGPDVAVPTPPAGEPAVRIDGAVYLAAHRRDPVATRPIVRDGEFYAPAPDQDWRDLVRQVYGSQLPPDVSDETLALLAEAIASLNGRSNLEAPPSMVSMPQLADVNRFLQGMRRDLSLRREPIVRHAVTAHTSDPTPAALPTQGRAYQAQWNDTLRGVALHAYSRQLTGLPPEQADARLRSIMLAIADVNGLNSTDLGDAGVIYLPRPDEIQSILVDLNDPARLQALQEDNPVLWRSIQRTGRGAVTDLRFYETRSVPPATSRDRLLEVIGSTDEVVRGARFGDMTAGPTGWNFWNIFSFNWLFGLWNEEPPPEEQLPIRRSGEDFASYLDRVAPNMPPEEYRRVLENPGRFMMQQAGIMNRNGDIDQARAQQLTVAMQSLGIVDATGSWTVHPEPGESLQQAVDRKTFEAIRRAGIDIEIGPNDSFETVIARARAAATPEQQGLLRQLVIWNQLVLLGAEGETGNDPSTTSDPYQGMLGDLLAASSYGVPVSYTSGGVYYGKLDEHLKSFDDLAYVEYGHEDDPLYEDPDQRDQKIEAERAADRIAAHHEAQRQGAKDVEPTSEQFIAERNHARFEQQVAAESIEASRRVSVDTADENVEKIRREIQGKPVGPGVKRPGPPK